MKCAIVPETKLKFLQEFCNEFEEAIEEYKNSRADDEDREKLIGKIMEFKNIPSAIQHLSTAYQTIYDAACDPTLTYLDFKPELKVLEVPVPTGAIATSAQ